MCGVLGAVLAVAISLAAVAPVFAETRVAALTKALTSRSDKTRLSAVLALAKLGEPAALKPLITALRDPSARVRVVAATALGRLECDEALPTLRALSTADRDENARKAASTAAIKIATRRRQDERAAESESQARRAPVAARMLDHAALSDEPHAALYVLVNSSADDSPGFASVATRHSHADVIRRVLTEQLRTEASVTSIGSDARRWGLDARHIDLSVTKLDVKTAGGTVEIDAQLRIAISDDSGKMLSFLSGGAKLQVPSQKFDRRYLPVLRKEALENAMRGMFAKLLAHLREQAAG
jgi:hypothetical protein